MIKQLRNLTENIKFHLAQLDVLYAQRDSLLVQSKDLTNVNKMIDGSQTYVDDLREKRNLLLKSHIYGRGKSYPLCSPLGC